MTREEQINAHCIYARFDYNEIFKRGVNWADEHPSDDTILRLIGLYHDAIDNGNEVSQIEYIKQHWNDEKTA